MWQSKSRIASTLVFLGLFYAVARDPAAAQRIVADSESPRNELRKAIFKGSLNKRSCKLIETTPTGGVSGFDADLDAFIKKIIASIESQKAKSFLPLFHEGMKVKFAAVNHAFKKLNSVYQAPFDVSVFRLWALNTVDGTTDALACDGERLKVYPLYGHKLQFGLWLQIMGQKELGRIYLALLPSKDRWNVASFHSQQWTHDSKDFATWTAEANKASRMGYPMGAWAKYDLAYKLLSSGGFLDIAMQKDIKTARDALMTREEWNNTIKKTLKEADVAYTASMLVTGGVGILARIRVKKEISLVDMRSRCDGAAKALIKKDWHRQFVGVRCSFLMPREDPKKEGGLGGMLVRFAEFKAEHGIKSP